MFLKNIIPTSSPTKKFKLLPYRLLLQWNPVNTDTKGTSHSVRITECRIQTLY